MEISTVDLIKKITDKGYIRVFYNGNWIYEHILVVEKFIGRELNDNECVHHINQCKQDNRLSNLCLFTNSQHSHFHRQLKQFKMTTPRRLEIENNIIQVKLREIKNA